MVKLQAGSDRHKQAPRRRSRPFHLLHLKSIGNQKNLYNRGTCNRTKFVSMKSTRCNWASEKKWIRYKNTAKGQKETLARKPVITAKLYRSKPHEMFTSFKRVYQSAVQPTLRGIFQKQIHDMIRDFNSWRRRGRLRLITPFVANQSSSLLPPDTCYSVALENKCDHSLFLWLIIAGYETILKFVVIPTITRLPIKVSANGDRNIKVSEADYPYIQANNANGKQRKSYRCNKNNNNSNNIGYFCNNKTGKNISKKISSILYIYLLFAPMIYPCGRVTGFALAARPKSAVQTSQQVRVALNGNAVSHSIAGENGALPTYHLISNEETEFLYPSQAEMDMFEESTESYRFEDQRNKSAVTNPNKNAHLPANVTKTPLFPKDFFTKEELENGAVIVHVVGVIYMFVALAIVCDEFFVPSLDVIIEKFDITDDVAGATFMAAGGSAPELFTSVIGVFVSFDDVGIGTIVGSAVFNILFVIGMCALFSKTVLTLTWWPLFRDCSFYSISLVVLIYFFRDNKIFWWEALILFCIYITYVSFMKFNVEVEQCVKRLISKNKVTRVRSTDQLMPGNAANSSETSMATQPGGSVASRAASETRSGATAAGSGAPVGGTQTGAKFRHGLLQLMIHTIDPLHDGKVDEKATQLHAIASLKVLLDATKPQRGGATTSAANNVKTKLKETTLADRSNGNVDVAIDSPSLNGRRPSWIEQRVKIQARKFSVKTQEIEEEPEPLNMAWPDTARKRFTYILVAPLLVPMWLTLPDTRTPRGKRFFVVTFIGSIVWIAIFSYLMVWWANVIGDTARIPPEVMGLTFLAAGTSIPDLITSVIVARKGFGDMAVSSSVGSNIFDVTVGLPIPWLMFGIFYEAPVEVNSKGMVCSITILFMMLVFVVISIAYFRWRMNKGLGLTMFLLYFVFVSVSLMFEYKTLTCPV